MSPERPPLSNPPLSVPQCVESLRERWGRLDRERQEFGQPRSLAQAQQVWADFRLQWLSALRREEARCAVDQPGRLPLRRAFHELERVEDLYTTAAFQYETEIYPSVARFRRELAAAELAP